MIDTAKKWFFIDLNSGDNLENGLPYFAAGVVTDFFDLECSSGKHMVVEFISPFGEVQVQWRDKSQVKLIEADSYNYSHLCEAIAQRQLEPAQ